MPAKSHRSSPSKTRRSSSAVWPWRAVLVAAATLAVIGMALAGIWAIWTTQSPSAGRRPSHYLANRVSRVDVQNSIARGAFAEAAELVVPLLDRAPNSPELLLLAAQAHAELGHTRQAIEFCDRVARNGSPESEVAAWVPCELLMQAGELSAAIARMEQCLVEFPDKVQARKRLIAALALCGRGWETLPHHLILLQQAEIDGDLLIQLGSTARISDARAELERLSNASPDDPLPKLGLARLDLAENAILKATKRLEGITRTSPNLIEAWARLGEARLSLMRSEGEPVQADWEQFAAWNNALPAIAEQHPQVWWVRGIVAEQLDAREEAARCFWEAVRRDPNHVAALYQLGQTLLYLGRPAEAELILDRQRRLVELNRSLDGLAGKNMEVEAALDVAMQAEACGRLWEAWAWTGIATTLSKQNVSLQTRFQQLAQRLEAQRPPLTTPDQQPASQVNLASLPLPKFDASMGRLANHGNPSAPDQSPLSERGDRRDASRLASPRFRDDAVPSNLTFQYFSSPTPGAEGKHIYEFGGGGIAILDFDLDGWPDVYLTQGCQWPPNSSSSTEANSLLTTEPLRNQLFRNIEGSFSSAPVETSAADTGFGQGATVGDFNGDGFPDLYIANIGPNRLYVNNGDGTFSDSTQLVDGSSLPDRIEEQWTTSCVMADINGDGLPDLYDVNYLTGTDIFSRVCLWPQGKQRICGPSTHRPLADQFFLNTGQGFEHVSLSSHSLPPQNGLGVVVGRLDASDLSPDTGLQLFIANDQQANYLLRFKSNAYRRLSAQADNDPTANETLLGDQPTSDLLEDDAISMGLAFDAQGSAQACMGVAAGDADGDGSIDLFVTNFYRESNTLYAQRSAGQFVDRSNQAQLATSSFSMLGFGTQFLDADLDGDLDLVLTNGHLDDFSYMGQPYHMRPQFFANAGQGIFVELTSESLGDYFSRPLLGRSLARLDWNRDGREDFIVSHLDAPAALLTNATANAGNYVVIELRGVESSRDAIGTTVIVQTQDRRMTRQLTAGDGYQASNQRQLVFGLGDAEVVDQLSIAWPSGLQQTLREPLPANRTYLVVEGQSPRGLPAR